MPESILQVSKRPDPDDSQLDAALHELLQRTPSLPGGLDRIHDLITAELGRMPDQQLVSVTAPDRITSASVGVSGGWSSHRRWIRPTMAAAVLSGVMLLGAETTAPPAAAANWSAVPRAVNGQSFTEMQAACREFMNSKASAVVAEQRGTSTYTVLSDTSECLSFAVPQPGAGSGIAAGGQSDPTTALIALAASDVSIIESGMGGGMSTGPDSDHQTMVTSFERIFGRVGSGVTGVVVHRTNGTDVTATVQNGWFVAWWPGGDDASTVTVTGKFGSYQRQASLG